MEGKRLAVVTGGAGFVGSHLCERLVREGFRVISLDNYFTGSIKNHVSGVEYRTGHTKDIAMHVAETPDILYHLGEYARTEKSFEDIHLVWDLNKAGTFGVLEFWRKKKCKLVYAGSSTKFADDGAGRDQSPYAWTKASNTELVQNYATWFGLNYAITYFYNVYGPREMSGSYGTLISIFNELQKQGQPLTIVAPGTQLRNFTHVHDIVEGLFLVGEKGDGDEYGIGSDEAYSVIDVANMFGGEHIMLPERPGNRMASPVHSEKTKALGWQPTQRLQSYIEALKQATTTTPLTDPRILVFTTTYYPHMGHAECALEELIRSMPHVHFDIVTTCFSREGKVAPYELSNVTITRVGFGTRYDKFLLPFVGARAAVRLTKKHTYIFSWALFASYAALAALVLRTQVSLPILITLGDQRLDTIPWYMRFVSRFVLGHADQVYAMDTDAARTALSFSERSSLVRSIGSGDTFANQIRFAYSQFLKKRLD